MATTVPINTQPVPVGFCFQDWITSWPTLVGLLSAEVTGLSYVIGSTLPAVEDRDKAWFRLNTDGTPDRWYVWANGYWLAQHPIPPGPSGIVVMYEGTEVSIDTFDGGEAGVITTTTGPMWQKVAEMNARFPVGPGTFSPSGKVVAIGEDGGTDQTTLASIHIPFHKHDVKQLTNADDGSSQHGSVSTGTGLLVSQTEGFGGDPNQGNATQPFTNRPPYRGIWFIRRTARLYYRV